MADFYLLGNTSHSQMFGCVIKTKKKTVVIDGGTYKDSNQLVDFLKKESACHVDAWFFTHPHHDHKNAASSEKKSVKKTRNRPLCSRIL